MITFPGLSCRAPGGGSYTDVVTQHIHHCYHNGHCLHRDDAFEVTVVSVFIRVEITEVLE